MYSRLRRWFRSAGSARSQTVASSHLTQLAAFVWSERELTLRVILAAWQSSGCVMSGAEGLSLGAPTAVFYKITRRGPDSQMPGPAGGRARHRGREGKLADNQLAKSSSGWARLG